MRSMQKLLGEPKSFHISVCRKLITVVARQKKILDFVFARELKFSHFSFYASLSVEREHFMRLKEKLH